MPNRNIQDPQRNVLTQRERIEDNTPCKRSLKVKKNNDPAFRKCEPQAKTKMRKGRRLIYTGTGNNSVGRHNNYKYICTECQPAKKYRDINTIIMDDFFTPVSQIVA